MAADSSPVLDEITYPAYIGLRGYGVPMWLFGINLAVWAILAILVSDLFAGTAPLMCVGGGLVSMAWIGVRFARDPHIERVWYVRWFKARRLSWERSRNLVVEPGNKYCV